MSVFASPEMAMSIGAVGLMVGAAGSVGTVNLLPLLPGPLIGAPPGVPGAGNCVALVVVPVVVPPVGVGVGAPGTTAVPVPSTRMSPISALPPPDVVTVTP